jgi:hypothetical protein
VAQLPITEFLQDRLKEYDPNFEVRKGSAFDTLIFKPLSLIMQPLRDELDHVFIGQSLRRILQTERPDEFSEESVDDLVSNVYVYRYEGSKAGGVARVYYEYPVDREFPSGGIDIKGNNGKNYSNPAPFAITAGEMSRNVENAIYYMDIPVLSDDFGEDLNLEPDSLVSVENDPDVILVSNKNRIQGGSKRETNTELIERARKSISVRDLVTGKGFSSVLIENFPSFIREISAIGFGDPEMMRDILFNTHVGGKHDGYIKTSYITTLEKDFIGVLIDPTRSAFTTTQKELSGTTPVFLGQVAIDRSVGNPVVKEVKVAIPAEVIGDVEILSPINLSAKQYLKITIDGVTKTVRVAGEIPSQTLRTEVVIAINNAFGLAVASSLGSRIKVLSPSPGKDSNVIIEEPDSPFASALEDTFSSSGIALSSQGDGPVTFLEDVHYTISNPAGTIARVLGPVRSITSTEGITTVEDSDSIEGPIGQNIFANILEGDIVTLNHPDITGDYRVLEVLSADEIVVDHIFDDDYDLEDSISIRGTGIKDKELVYVEYYHNPVSIDIGKYVKLDSVGRNRGIRPSRDEYTITEVPLLRILSIEVIDPISGEPTGETLSGIGGYGMGGFGRGGFGIGSSAQYRLVVNSPTERFSIFEDAFISIDSAYQGFSFRIAYECVPELEDIHNFCRSDKERVLDGDILIKHFIPVYVSTTIYYSVDETDSEIPDNEILTNLVREFINTRPHGTNLDISDVKQFILSKIDPFFSYKSMIQPFTLTGVIHNTDGSLNIIKSSSYLEIPTPDPFPKYTDSPLSGRICHYLAGEIELVRLN